MLTAYATPVPSEVENVNAPLLAMLRSLAPLLRTTNVPVRPDTVPPIVTVTGGGGLLPPPLPPSLSLPPLPQAAHNTRYETAMTRAQTPNNFMVDPSVGKTASDAENYDHFQ